MGNHLVRPAGRLRDAVPAGTILDGELVAGQGRPGDFYRLGPGLSARNRRMPVSFVAFESSPSTAN